MPARIWSTRTQTFLLGKRALLMGVLNVTPDSFSDGGRYVDANNALHHAEEMLKAGADILDIGGESTRPGASPVSLETELRRTIPLIRAIKARFPCIISIDTSKAEVARQAIEAGAEIVNDVTALRGDPAMAEVCARTGVGVILMHMQGTPRTMQANPTYADVVEEIRAFFGERAMAATTAGIAYQSLAFDPGIGFGKLLEHNLRILNELEALRIDNAPLAIGFSRKSFIAKILETEDLQARKWPSVALTSLCREHGADVIRVHDVQECHDALRITEAVIASAAP